MAVPYTFASRTTAIALSELDSNFSSVITLGNTAMQLGNTVSSVSDLTLANATISSGNVTVLNATVTNANVTTANITTLNVTTFNPANLTAGNLTYTTSFTGNVDATVYGVRVGRGNAAVATNTTVGASALNSVTTGVRLTSVGASALANVTSGQDLVAVGTRALLSNTTGVQSVAVGSDALNKHTTGYNNIGVGWYSLFSVTTGIQNTSVGTLALSGVTTGLNNTAIGSAAGTIVTTGEQNTYVGSNVSGSAAGVNNETVIGSAITGKGNNTAFIGGTNGAYNGQNATTWVTTSDRRIKRNIEDNHQGLAVIERIRVRNFEYRLPDEIDPELPRSAAIDKPGVQIGVIAQEMQEVLPECVTANSTGVLSVNTDPLVWHLINAVKQLSARVAELEAKQ